MRLAFVLALVLSLAAFVGCRPDKPSDEQPFDRGPATSRVEIVWAQIGDFYAKGDTNAVFDILEKHINDEEFKPHAAAMLCEIVTIQLRRGEEEVARQRVLAEAANSMEMVGPACGAIAGYLHRQERGDDLVAWGRTLLELGQESGGTQDEANTVAAQMGCTYVMQGYHMEKKFDEIFAFLPEMMEILSPAAASGIVERLLTSCLQAGNHEDLERVIEHLAEKFPAQPGLDSLVAFFRVQSMIDRTMLEEAGATLVKSLGSLSEGQASVLLVQLRRAAAAAKKDQLLEGLYEQLVTAPAAGKRIKDTAARGWVMAARDAGQVEETFQRLNTVLASEDIVARPLSLVHQVFYQIMKDGSDETRDALMALSEKLRETAETDADKTQSFFLLLDGCFMRGDFDKALALASRGVPGKDETESAMFVVKIKAHAALAKGRKREAIDYFTEFMQLAASRDEADMMSKDPESGLMVTRAEILGLNAARIAKLWGEIGDQAKAEVSLQEARAYYQDALEAVGPDSPEEAAIQAKLKELASGG